MKTSEHGRGADRGGGNERGAQSRGGEGGRPPLLDALVWPRCVEVGPVVRENAPEMRLAQHEDVVEALPAQGAETALRECIRLRGEDGGADDADPCRLGGCVERRCELSVVVAEKELRASAERRKVAELLEGPGGCGRQGGSGEKDPACFEVDDDEDVVTAEPKSRTSRKSQAHMPAACWRRKGNSMGQGQEEEAIPGPEARSLRTAGRDHELMAKEGVFEEKLPWGAQEVGEGTIGDAGGLAAGCQTGQGCTTKGGADAAEPSDYGWAKGGQRGAEQRLKTPAKASLFLQRRSARLRCLRGGRRVG